MNTYFESLKTKDGETVELKVFEPESFNEIVIFIHGYSQNYNTWGKEEESLPFFVANNGFVSAIVNLRGHGKKKLVEKNPSRIFEKYYSYDVPGVIDFLFKKYGKLPYHVVGHSLGGLVGLFFSYQAKEKPKSFVAIASPLKFYRFKLTIKLLFLIFLCIYPFLKLFRIHYFPIKKFAKSALKHPKFYKILRKIMGTEAWYDKNVSKELLKFHLEHSYVNETVAIHKDMAHLVFSPKWRKKVDNVLKNFNVKSLVIAARKDGFVNRETVSEGYGILGSRNKEFYITHHDCGHVDILWGNPDNNDIFNKILNFLKLKDESVFKEHRSSA